MKPQNNPVKTDRTNNVPKITETQHLNKIVK